MAIDPSRVWRNPERGCAGDARSRPVAYSPRSPVAYASRSSYSPGASGVT
jgi:hypothetical protein